MGTLEQVIEAMRNLTPDEQRVVSEMFSQSKQNTERARRQEAIHRAMGSMKDVLSSTDNFLIHKRQEVEIEERKCKFKGFWRPRRSLP